MTVYGIHPVAEALRAGRVTSVRAAEDGGERVRAVVVDARRAGVTVTMVPRLQLDQELRHALHQGVAADVAASPARSLRELADATGESPPLIVVLDGVEDPQNVGAILRSVDAAGGTGVVRQTRRAAPLGGAAARASAGAVHHVPVVDVVNIARAVEELKSLQVWTVGLDADALTPYYEIDLTLPTAFVLGAEERGLRRLVREHCDWVCAIPQAGHVGSLNVAAAAAVVLFDALRQRRQRTAGLDGRR